MKLYFRNPRTGAIRERVCEKGQKDMVIKEESIIGYTQFMGEYGPKETK